MAGVTSYDAVINRISNGKSFDIQVIGESAAAPANITAGSVTVTRVGSNVTLPSVPAGTTDYKILAGMLITNVAFPVMIYKLVNLGTLNIGTNTFTDGSAMPTVGGTQSSGICIVEVTTALNATPGAFTATYVNQAGTGGKVSTSSSLTASAAVGQCGILRFAAGDNALQDITAATQSGGTTPSGVLQFWGCLPIATLLGNSGTTGNLPNTFNNLTSAFNFLPLAAGDKVGFFSTTSASATGFMGSFTVLGDS